VTGPLVRADQALSGCRPGIHLPHRRLGLRQVHAAPWSPGWSSLILPASLVLGILVHVLFSLADRAIRRRWGLTGSS
jgi:hypothetical protein